MIPKKIHYCWFGRGEKPKLAQKCIASWRKYMPDYEIIEWNEDNFDVNRNAYTKMCYEQKKYAFLTDYLRLVIIEEQGGIYFDTDVEAVRSFDDLLENPAYCYHFSDTTHKNVETPSDTSVPASWQTQQQLQNHTRSSVQPSSCHPYSDILCDKSYFRSTTANP